MIKKIVPFFFVLLLAFPAQAQDYAKPTWPNLARTLIRFNALSLTDDKLLDEYAAITECDLYKGLYSDDFKWNKVRIAIRQSIQQNVATFPVNYAYDAQLQLDHYDFHNKQYRLTDKTIIHNVNTFVIYEAQGPACGTVSIKDIPSAYRAVIDEPVSFDGLPLEEKDAQALLKQMKDDKDTNKIIYARFNLRIIYIAPLQQASIKGEDRTFTSSKSLANSITRMDVHLDSIDFYEDPSLTRLIYHYQP